MTENILVIAAILFPVLTGAVLLAAKGIKKPSHIYIYTGISLVTSGILAVLLLPLPEWEFVLFNILDGIPILFKLDSFGKFFIVLVSISWILAGFYSFSYMEHEENKRRYFGFYLIVYGVLIGLGCSGNLITMYAFYEFMTLSSFPLVVHNQSGEAVMAALKYLFYSFFGAYMALFGVFFLCKYTDTLTFTPGGTLNAALSGSHSTILLIIAFLMILGFGVKAGIFPMHAWLTTAHPVAPAPASGVLSGIIVKAGVLAIIRTVFYIIGADFLKGTWVQYAFLILSLSTVFLGSMLAFHEKVLKKRLAYSTVSQISYILFGIALFNPIGLTGSMLHMAAHSLIKCVLFLGAGAIIHKTGITTIDGITGIGKKMPAAIWCFTIVSLGLIGIPPTGGFISKWYLATGALNSQLGVFAYIGPVVLLVSALLTAGYLLPVTIRGFFPGEDFKYSGNIKNDADWIMLVPMMILTGLSVLLGMFPNGVIEYITEIVGKVL